MNGEFCVDFCYKRLLSTIETGLLLNYKLFSARQRKTKQNKNTTQHKNFQFDEWNSMLAYAIKIHRKDLTTLSNINDIRRYTVREIYLNVIHIFEENHHSLLI